MDSDGNPSLPLAPSDVTQLLARVREGDRRAWDDLLERVQAELRAMAHRQLLRERPGHLLQTTALVNEVYLRLVRDDRQRIESRSEFLSIAASAMRRVLVDEARARKALRRGGGAAAARVSQIAEITPAPDAALSPDGDLEALEHALVAFEADARHAQKSRVVELRYFAGLTIEETAEVTGTSIATVKRDWEFARAWLQREMSRLAHGT